MGEKQNTDLFKKRMHELNTDIEVLGEYINARTGIECRCVNCGLKWMPLPTNLLRRARCPRCVGRYRRTHDDFIKDLQKVNSDIEVLGEFTTTAKRIKVRCRVCGHIWNPSANSLLQGFGCSKCRSRNNAERFSMSEKDFLG